MTNYHVIGNVLGQASRSAGERKVAQVARITLLGADGFTHEYIADLVGACPGDGRRGQSHLCACMQFFAVFRRKRV